MELKEILYITTIALFFLGEVFCIYVLIKYCRSEVKNIVKVVIMYVCFCVSLIVTILYFLHHQMGLFNSAVSEFLSYCSGAMRNMFWLFLSIQILELIDKLEIDNKLPKVLIKLIWILMLLCLIASLALYIFLHLSPEKSMYSFQFYVPALSIEIVIGVVYSYSAAKILIYFRNQRMYRKSKYLKWMFITIIYMIFAFELRLIQNAYHIIEGKSDDPMYQIYFIVFSLLVGLAPTVFMNLCILALLEQQANEKLDEENN